MAAKKRFAMPPRIAALVRRVQSLRAYRSFANFSENDGDLLAAGMSYHSLFAIFAAIWVGFSVAGIWLASSPLILQQLITIINQTIPGLIERGGAIDPRDLQLGSTFGWTGALAAIGLLLTAVGWLDSTRLAIRAMFGLPHDTTNFLLQKVRDLGLGLAFGVVLIVSALLSIASTQALTFILGLFGLSENSLWTVLAARVVGLLVAVLLYLVVLAAMFRVLSRVPIPLRTLIVGSLIGSVALAALSTLGGVLLGGAGNNPLLAAFAVIIGLLVWFNLICRIILLAASWIAVGMADMGRILSVKGVRPTN
ncbi:MAG TPA: YihY/virulence factor BrkB family protein [Microbacteriaceae bacterium]|nr:YihY/virulence factor BrkB family protein [Microbacteriaceae bacterium]